MKESWRVLKPGGRLIALTPDWKSQMKTFYNDYTHVRPYTVDSLGDLLPPEIVNRPKMGFSLPYAQWMKSELREFCGERIQRLAGRELFNGAAVAGCWKDFLDGKQTMTWSRVWTLVVLEHWLERNGVA